MPNSGFRANLGSFGARLSTWLLGFGRMNWQKITSGRHRFLRNFVKSYSAFGNHRPFKGIFSVGNSCVFQCFQWGDLGGVWTTERFSKACSCKTGFIRFNSKLGVSGIAYPVVYRPRIWHMKPGVGLTFHLSFFECFFVYHSRTCLIIFAVLTFCRVLTLLRHRARLLDNPLVVKHAVTLTCLIKVRRDEMDVGHIPNILKAGCRNKRSCLTKPESQFFEMFRS